MRFRFLLPVCFSLSLCAQTAPPEPQKPLPTAETVLAVVDGHKLTFGELQTYLEGLPPENRQAALADRKQLLQQYALMSKLLSLAEHDKLADESPYKETLEANRKQILTRAELQYKYLHMLVTPADQKTYFSEHADRYTQAKIQVLYLGFVNDPPKDAGAKKYRTEAQAKKQIGELRAQIHSGEDFVKLVKQYSEDEASKAKDGDYGTLKKSDNLPDDIKSVVFSLKEGEVSQPVPQRNGFYLFRAASIGPRPYDEVRDEIYNELKDTRVREWLEKTQREIPIKIENAEFFAAPPAKK